MGVGSDPLLYVGTYTNGASGGIYRFRLQMETGAVEPLGVTVAEQPSFLALHPTQPWLYAVSETTSYAGAPGGSVCAYAIEPGSGSLRLLGCESSGGAAPCHLHLDRTGQYLLVANYGGGSVAVLPLRPDGGLGALIDLIQHAGAGLDPVRQAGPHVHAVLPDPTNRYLLVADLGLDQVNTYPFNVGTGRLGRNGMQVLLVPTKAGPRHMAWHPSGRFAYLVGEMDSTVMALSYADGALTQLQRHSTLPAGADGANHPAEIAVHPSGRFLYVSNRGHDSIAVYRVDEESGQLGYVSHHKSLGAWPRHFGIDPTGRYLLVANQKSSSLVSFAIDAGSGELAATGAVSVVPDPTCVLFVGGG